MDGPIRWKDPAVAMPLHGAVLSAHIAAGALALVSGPLALVAPRRPGWSRRLGLIYRLAVAGLAVTALALVALKPQLWWLAPIAVATWAVAEAGARLRRPAASGRWTPAQVRLLGGSYVSLVTAAFVVSSGGPLAWALPPLLGFVAVELTAARAGEDRLVATSGFAGLAVGRGSLGRVLRSLQRGQQPHNRGDQPPASQ